MQTTTSRAARPTKGIDRAGAEGLTLAAFAADVWAPKARRRLAPKTWERDTRVYDKHVLPRLGARPIAEIDAEVLVEWQDDLEETGVGAPTIIKAMSILSGICREAARRPRTTGMRSDPVALLERPSTRRRRRPRVWGPVVVEQVRHELIVGSRRIGEAKRLVGLRDALLVAFGEMTGCRPGEALALRWRDISRRIEITHALSGTEIVDRTKTETDRVSDVLAPLASDLAVVRRLSGDGPDEHVLRTPTGRHWTENDWRNFRARHFRPALARVEAGWGSWREGLSDPGSVRESVTGLSKTRPYDLGRHTHSALMLASGMSLQRLARIQGHSIRVLDETYSEQLAEYEERRERIDPVAEIEAARRLVWGELDPSTGRPRSDEARR